MSTNSNVVPSAPPLLSAAKLAEARAKIDEKKLKILLIVGATRAGKSRLTSFLALHSLNDRGLFVTLSQDACYKEAKRMPMVRLQGAPYVRVANWDDKDSVTWQALCARLIAAINGAANEQTIVIEGTMLLECEPLVQLATSVICIELDKWECFERRAMSDGRRQCHYPYMLEMWRLHCNRFYRAFQECETTGFMYLSQENLKAIIDGTVEVGEGQTVYEFLDDQCSCDPTDFVDSITEDSDEKWFQPESYQRRVFGDKEESLCGRNFLNASTGDFVERYHLKTLLSIYLGVALGDASGAPFEFHRGRGVVWPDGKLTVPLVMSGAGGVRGAPAGAITDDFQMTLLALRTLIANNMHYEPEAHIQAYIDWASDHPGGIGRNTLALFQHSKTVNKKLAFEKYRRVFDERHQSLADCSKSNGTLMRAAAFVAIPSIEHAIRAAVADAALTNSNTVNTFVSAIYVWILHQIVYQSMRLEKLSTWLTQERLRDIYNDYIASNTDIRLRSEADAKAVFVAVADAIKAPNLATLRRDLNVLECDMQSLINDKDMKGYVLVAFWVALRHTVLSAENNVPFGETIRHIVCLGGDTDTNAAIAGALLATSMVRKTLSNKVVNSALDVLCETEAYNLTTLMNVPYRYTTIKIVGNLIPERLGDTLALLPAAWKTFLQQKDNPAADVGSIADPLPTTSSAVATTNKRPSDDDDNDDDVLVPKRAKK